MQCLEVSGAVRLIYRSLGVKGLKSIILNLNLSCTILKIILKKGKMIPLQAQCGPEGW